MNDEGVNINSTDVRGLSNFSNGDAKIIFICIHTSTKTYPADITTSSGQQPMTLMMPAAVRGVSVSARLRSFLTSATTAVSTHSSPEPTKAFGHSCFSAH